MTHTVSGSEHHDSPQAESLSGLLEGTCLQLEVLNPAREPHIAVPPQDLTHGGYYYSLLYVQ